ncbi:hypothetical protein TeGR_g5142 [Tetraparma gracilis]|uniref:Beta-carotene isomerase D27-like C-terminal domain-containing protein n=1 Tax=Tetraparma gracilis TaxID=2962635 RepID=A0ABQ6N541_9STRA|nr:hypothetical protein TeGR_g5142 [Tetraparma gracilis]
MIPTLILSLLLLLLPSSSPLSAPSTPPHPPFDPLLAGRTLDPSSIVGPGFHGPLGPLLDSLLLSRFRASLDSSLPPLPKGKPAPPETYDGAVEMVRHLLRSYSSPAAATEKSREILAGLFPDLPPVPPPPLRKLLRLPPPLAADRGLLYWFRLLFSSPSPLLSARLNCLATAAFGQWLMGPCHVASLPASLSPPPPAAVLPAFANATGTLLLVPRCRFLEAAGCAELCSSSCRLPTQKFFAEQMGVPLRMVPDYERFSCEFQFGVEPSPEEEGEFAVGGCFEKCSMGKMNERRQPPASFPSPAAPPPAFPPPSDALSPADPSYNSVPLLQSELALADALLLRNAAQLGSFVDEAEQWREQGGADRRALGRRGGVERRLGELLGEGGGE